MIVELDHEQMLRAAIVGVERQAQKMHTPSRRGWNGSASAFGVGEWENHVQAAAAEYATAILLGKVWAPGPHPDTRHGDIENPGGPAVQVRWTKKANGRLRVERDDDSEHVYVLVRGIAPRMNVVAWLYGHEAKYERYLLHPPLVRESCYFAPVRVCRALPDRRMRALSSAATSDPWNRVGRNPNSEVRSVRRPTPREARRAAG